MICRNCNAEIDDSAAQCPFCGASTAADAAPQQQGAGQPQPSYSQPYSNPNQFMGGMTDPALEKDANTVKTLGIVSLILSFCCCVGPILGIVGLVKANGLSASLGMLSEQGQKNVNTGKTLCIIAIVLYAVFMVISMVTGGLSSVLEAMSE